jgi:sec-independent protein translocase protein TatB
MFEVGFTELLVIGALALIVLGPERLPKLAQQLGRWAGRARAMARQLRDQLDQEVHLQDERERRAQTPGAAAPPPPDIDDYGEPHDARSHRDAGTPEPESTAENCEQPPGATAAAGTGDAETAPSDATPAEAGSSPRNSP